MRKLIVSSLLALAVLAALLRSKVEPAKRTFTVIRRAGS